MFNWVGVGCDGESFNLSCDCLIFGVNIGLMVFKGFDIVDELGWVLVIENSVLGLVCVFGV